MIHNVELAAHADGDRQPKFFLVSCRERSAAAVYAYQQALASGFTNKRVQYYDLDGNLKSRVLPISPADFIVRPQHHQPISRAGHESN